MSDHTSGPWKYGGYMAPDLKIVWSETEEIDIAWIPPINQDANGRLIAAAPDLLEACVTGDGLGNEGPDLLGHAADLLSGYAPITARELLRKAKAERAAIAKARGEQQCLNT